MKTFYRRLIGTGNSLQHFLILAMRLYWGYAFFQAGLGKLNNILPVSNFFASLGIPFPTFNAYLVGCTEMIGGLCLLFGFASRLAAVPLAIVMITALLTEHADAVRTIFQNPQKFINQLPFNFLLATLVIFCFGPGGISIDYLLKRYIFKK